MTHQGIGLLLLQVDYGLVLIIRKLFFICYHELIGSAEMHGNKERSIILLNVGKKEYNSIGVSDFLIYNVKKPPS